MRLNRVGHAPFTLAVLLTLAGCSSGLDRPVREVTARTDPDGVQRISVTTHSYWFEPNRIVVKSGTPVEIKLHNDSWIAPHGFSCMAAPSGLDTTAKVGFIGRTKTIRFTPKEPGEYPFLCPVDSHAKKGMTGTLVVQS